MFVWWGPQLINFYNDAYIPVLGQRHPQALGQPAAKIWSEVWSTVGQQAEAVMERGQANFSEEQLLLLERNQFLEETILPIPTAQFPMMKAALAVYSVPVLRIPKVF